MTTSSGMRQPQLSPPTVSSADAIDLFMAEHAAKIRSLVRGLARSDDAMRDELEQSVRIALWTNDASRFTAKDAGLLLYRIDRRARDTRKSVRRSNRLGGRILQSHDLERFEANVVEPRYMRRARERSYDPQDPCTEDL